jgi:competence protein ComEC
MLDALCFNVDGGLEAGFEDSLRRSGTIHIVSASGLHTLVLAWIIDAVLGILPIPRPYRLTILAVLLSFYAAAAGLQPAIVRSVVMSMIALSAYLWQREADLLSGLALSSVLYLAWDPLGIYNIGFQFSFLTVGAFAIFGKFEEERLKSAGQAIRSVALGTVKTTTIAYVATLPLLSFYFGAISLVSVFANIAIVPAAITLVAVGMGAFMIYGVLPGLSEIAANGIISPLLTYLEAGVTYFGNLSVASINWGMNSGYWVVAIYVLMLIWARERVRPS